MLHVVDRRIGAAGANPDGTFSCTGDVPPISKALSAGANKIMAIGATSEAQAKRRSSSRAAGTAPWSPPR